MRRIIIRTIDNIVDLVESFSFFWATEDKLLSLDLTAFKLPEKRSKDNKTWVSTPFLIKRDALLNAHENFKEQSLSIFTLS